MPWPRQRRWTAGLTRVAPLVASGTLALGVCGGDAKTSPPVQGALTPTAIASPTTLNSSVGYLFPAIAADGAAGFDAVWYDRGVVTAHWSAATRVWAPAVHFADSGTPVEWPAIDASGSGAAAIAWATAPGDAIRASYRETADSPWQSTATLDQHTRYALTDPQIGVDEHGNAYAAWQNGEGIELADHPAGAVRWSRPVRVVRGDASSMSLVVNPAGALAMVWQQRTTGGLNGPSRGTGELKIKPAGQRSWLPTETLGARGAEMLQGDGPPPEPVQPTVAIDGDGNVFAVWQWPHRGTFYPRVGIAAASDRWRKIQFVALSQPGLDPAIATAGHARATVLWGGRAADISLNGRVSDVSTISDQESATGLTSDARGDLLADWTGTAIYRPAKRHDWCRPVGARWTSEEASAIGSDGTAMVIWHSGIDTNNPKNNNNDSPQPLLAGTLSPCNA